MKKIILILCGNFLWFGSVIKAQPDNSWTLEACITYALEQNIQVRKGSLSNQSLEYQAEQAKAQRFPSVSASIGQSFNWSRDDGSVSGESGIASSNGSNYSIS